MEWKGDATLSASVKTFHLHGVGCNCPALCLAAIAMTTRGKMESWGGGQDWHVGQHNSTSPQEVCFLLRYMTAEFQGFSGTFLWSISVRTVFLLYIDLDRSQINTCKFNHTCRQFGPAFIRLFEFEGSENIFFHPFNKESLARVKFLFVDKKNKNKKKTLGSRCM